jgi:Methyltransferase FkbM domain
MIPPQDCRPEFNGEYRCFWWLLKNYIIKKPIVVGAADDYHYLQALHRARWTLVEPSPSDAMGIHEYCRRQLVEALVVQQAITHDARIVDIYDNGSIFPKADVGKIQQLVAQGKIFDPYMLNQLKSGTYSRNQKLASLQSVRAEQVLDDSYDFLKIDVEGAECEIVEAIKNFLAPSAFVQYEFHSTWIHAGRNHKDMFDILPGWYHYLITYDGLVLQPTPADFYYYANFLATPFPLTAFESFKFLV